MMSLELQRALIHGFAVTSLALLLLLVLSPPTATTLAVSFALGLLAGIVTWSRERRA